MGIARGARPTASEKHKVGSSLDESHSPQCGSCPSSCHLPSCLLQLRRPDQLYGTVPSHAWASARTSMLNVRAWMIGAICGIVYHSTANRRPGAPRLGWPGGCPTAPPMACPRHVAPPHPAVLAHVSRGAGRFSCARPARGGAHVGKAVPCCLGGPREALSASYKPIRAGHDMDKRNDSREGQLHPRPAIDNPADGRSKL